MKLTLYDKTVSIFFSRTRSPILMSKQEKFPCEYGKVLAYIANSHIASSFTVTDIDSSSQYYPYSTTKKEIKKAISIAKFCCTINQQVTSQPAREQKTELIPSVIENQPVFLAINQNPKLDSAPTLLVLHAIQFNCNMEIAKCLNLRQRYQLVGSHMHAASYSTDLQLHVDIFVLRRRLQALWKLKKVQRERVERGVGLIFFLRMCCPITNCE